MERARLFGSQFWRIQSVIRWSHGFWAYGQIKHHGRGMCREAHSRDSQMKDRQKEDWCPAVPFEGTPMEGSWAQLV